MAKIIDLKTRAILAELPTNETPRVMKLYPNEALDGRLSFIACSNFGAHCMMQRLRVIKTKGRKKKSA